MTLANRISKLEAVHGMDDRDRWLNSLSDDELDAEIIRVAAQLKASLVADGYPCADWSNEQVTKLAKVVEAGGGVRPSEDEIAKVSLA